MPARSTALSCSGRTLCKPYETLNPRAVGRGRQVVNFPFPTRPDPGALAAAEACLRALGALDGSGALTGLGRAMAALPLHPRASRMILQVPPSTLIPPKRCCLCPSRAL